MFLIKKLFLTLFYISILFSNIIAKEEIKDSKMIENLTEDLLDINEDLENNIWITRYNNYLTYRKIEKDLSIIQRDAKKYSRWKGEKYKELSYQLYNKIKIKENELELISEYKNSPIGKKITPSDISKVPAVSNPIAIIEAMSYIQQLKENAIDYEDVNDELVIVLEKLQLKKDIYKQLLKTSNKKEYKVSIDKINLVIKDFKMVVDIVSTTKEVYWKKVEQVTQEVQNTISDEIWHTIKLLLIIIVLFVFTIISKKFVKKYIDDEDKQYTSNRLINFIFVLIIVFTVLFSYIDNVSYLVTILGFASAGIAIALKDWFMSIFGWMAIMTSGAVSVGDRIKVTRDGNEVVGDVLDISLLKISVREDITLTTYTKNRRAGRVFFIPNNYIFTDIISNYTFNDLRTVWDGIDFYITFDSNHKRAVEIAKNIVTSHAKGYTDLSKKRLQKMRKKYILRSANPEPRIFAFVEPYGIVISSWYYTNSHATLALRSTISMDILDAFKAADDITIAYPTQTLRVAGNAQSNAEGLLPGTQTNGLFDPPITG